MTCARNNLFDHSKPVVCHCISRCIRREARMDAKSRRRSLMARLRFLARYLAVDVLEVAILSNHLHLVAATHPELVAAWTDHEVAARFRSLCPDHRWRKRNRIATDLPARPEEIAAALAQPSLIAKWRLNLASVSFLHKLLKQKLARAFNLADDLDGPCWQGRFKSIVALDHEAIIAHMVYVALNPVRARMAKALDGYEFATVAERVEDLRRRIKRGEFAGAVRKARERLRDAQLLPAMPCDAGPAVRAMPTLPCGARNEWFGGAVPPVIPSAMGGSTLAAFLHDVDAEGRERAIGKRGVIPESTPPVLAALDAELAAFAARELASSPLMRAARSLATELESAMSRTRNGARGNLSGGAAALAMHAKAMGRRFVVGIVGRPEDGGVRRVRAASEGDGQTPTPRPHTAGRGARAA